MQSCVFYSRGRSLVNTVAARHIQLIVCVVLVRGVVGVGVRTADLLSVPRLCLSM